jgi:DNA segregation ATPase FtsK/SpoIIIE-like protein
VRAGQNQYKIGISGNVDKRIAALQTSNINLVELVCAKRTTVDSQLEKKLHKKVREFSGTGGKEWFHLTPEQAIEVAIEISSAPNIDIADIVIHDLKVKIANIIDEYEVKISEEQKQIADMKAQLLLRASRNEVYAPSEVSRPKVPSLQDREDARTLADEKEYTLAKEIVLKHRHASTSFLQRHMRIGYAKAARLIERMEMDGIVSSLDGIKRDLLI